MSFFDIVLLLFLLIMLVSIAMLKLMLNKQIDKCNELQNELSTKFRLSKDEKVNILKDRIHELNRECDVIRTRYQIEVSKSSSIHSNIITRNAEIERWRANYEKSNEQVKKLELQLSAKHANHEADFNILKKEKEELLESISTSIDVIELFLLSSTNRELTSVSYEFITALGERWLPAKRLPSKEELNIYSSRGHGYNPNAADNLSGLQHVDGTWVVGHYRNGTWVEGHYRSAYTRYR